MTMCEKESGGFPPIPEDPIEFLLMKLFWEKLSKVKTWEEWIKVMKGRTGDEMKEAYEMLLKRECEENGGTLPMLEKNNEN